MSSYLSCVDNEDQWAVTGGGEVVEEEEEEEEEERKVFRCGG